MIEDNPFADDIWAIKSTPCDRTGRILETDRHEDADVVALVLKYLNQGSFKWIQDVAFTTSIEQLARRVTDEIASRRPFR